RMSVFAATSRRFALGLDAPGSTSREGQFQARIAAFCVIGALVFNALLCLVNTRIVGIPDSHVMLSEMVLLGLIFMVALSRRPWLYLVLGVYLSYMLLVFALRGQADLKALRDILIPIGFYFAGHGLANLKLADRLVVASTSIVLVFGLFEYVFLELYISFFNVIGYYVARGSVTLDQLYGQTTGLFISGMRPSARSILPFLGLQRVSSVFL